MVAGRVEAHLLTGMSCHGCKLREAYLVPFLCQGRALVAVEAAWAPFDIFPPLLRVDLTSRGRAR
jgi:hypothetical protein